jgi:hypothetical protein
MKTSLISLNKSFILLAFSLYYLSLLVVSSLADCLFKGVSSTLFRLYKRVLYVKVSFL